ncbi:hypothetical protein, partial [Leptospira gomenensis]|uniref:hypothetical protein n=1 Tax=Leptospira gomenensis TaxID=2484974 RepID=UPI0014382A0A
KAALYDYATLLEYSKHSNLYQNGESVANGELPAGYIDTPKKLAKERADAAIAAFEAKKKEVEALKKKMDSQVSLADLQAYVKNEREEAEKWAQLSVKYNNAEQLLRQKISNLKVQVANQQRVLDTELDKIWPLPLGKTDAGMYEDLGGALDFDSEKYLKTEEWNRDRMRMVEGMIQNEIGAMDVIMGHMSDYSAAMSKFPPAGAGMPQYDVG